LDLILEAKAVISTFLSGRFVGKTATDLQALKVKIRPIKKIRY
jgi:hypothetical protein